MIERSMSDHIEAFIKQHLETKKHLEIKRSDIADHFDCVPSQINYVIKTRFTQEQGYLVESKRGGGGYIRILKINIVDECDQINQLIDLVGDRINQRNGIHIIQNLVENSIITKREATLILSVIEKSVLHTFCESEQFARAQLLRTFLEQLRYTYE